MAIRKLIDENAVLTSVPPQMRDRYTCRIKDANFKMSSNDNPMIILDPEIIEPEKKEFDGKTYDLTGLKFPIYLVLTDNSFERVAAAHKALELSDEIDDENPDIDQYKGIIFDIILDSYEDKPMKRNPETGGTEPIKDGEGKEITLGWRINAQPDKILSRRRDLEETYESTRPY